MFRRMFLPILLLTFGLTIGVASGQSVIKVNFQSATQGSGEVPLGYLPDYGDVFGDRGNGFSYGWSVDKTGSSRDRDSSRSPDQRYDTLNDFVHWQTGTGFWEIAIPNSTYNVYIVSGDPGYLDQTNSYDVEGTIITDLTPQPQLPRWDEHKVTVTVADGHLTVDIAPGADPKICFIHIADANVAQPISPPDRSLWQSTSALLTWTPGLNAVQHDVYLGTNFNDVNNANNSTPDIYKGRQDPNSYSASGLIPGTTYYWRIDEVNGDNVWKGDIWAFTVQLLTAYDPQPFDGEIFVDPNVVLSWSKGATAALHYIYFGDSYESVRDATSSSPEFKGLKASGTTTWDPPDSLSLNKTYYWRVDEMESGGTTCTGAVWSFTTATRLGGGVKGRYYNNSTFTEPPTLIRIDPQIDFDWGLDSPDPNITNVDDFSVRWTGQIEIPASGEWTFWLQVEHGVRLWVNGQLLIEEEPGIIAWYSATVTLEAGFYPIMMEYYEIGNIALVQLLWQGPLVPIRQVIPSGAFTPPYAAGIPNPQNGAEDVKNEPTLSWSPGDKATKHEIYFGTDEDAVENATTAAPEYKVTKNLGSESYKPGTLEFNTTYYWRIDEVNDPNIWKGGVWSFTTGNYLVVDDFEDYNDYQPDRIFDTWIDGWGIAANGSQVGYGTPPFAEQTIVNSGSQQSMPLSYDNTAGVTYSEAVRTFDNPQDWTREDAQTLTLFFRGYPAAFIEDPTGTYTMAAAGSDIWGQSDEFRYAYKMLSGDGSISARVVSVENTDSMAKAGVMIRETLDPFSMHGFMCITPESRRAFQNRPETAFDSFSAHGDPNSITIPGWVRLERQGNNITAYYSEDGIDWIQQPDDENTGDDASVNPQTIVMRQDIHVGLAVCSHNANAICTAVFSDIKTTGAVSGDWQVEAIGVDMPANDPAQLYIIVKGGGTEKVVEHPDNPNAVLTDDWQRWDISLSVLSDAGVDLASIENMTIGVGQTDGQDGAGTMYFDDIRLYRPNIPEPNAPAEE
jgi:hypothetical protein